MIREIIERLIRFSVYNNSGEEIPPFGCMELDLSFDSGRSAFKFVDSDLVIQVKKPTSNNISKPELYIINGPFPIAVDGYGSGYKLPIQQVLIDGSTPPDVSTAIGPQDASWLMSTSGSGWVVKSSDVGPAYSSGSTKSVFAELVGGGCNPGFYKAAEDIYPGRDWFYANPCNRDGTGVVTSVFEKVYDWEDLLLNMLAGYQMATIIIKGERCFLQCSCIPTTCAMSGASITLTSESGDATAGTVGAAYTFSGIASSGLSGAITATGLPPGLSIGGTTISGTPTTAGTYYVILTGPVSSPSGCDVTRALKIVINEAA